MTIRELRSLLFSVENQDAEINFNEIDITEKKKTLKEKTLNLWYSDFEYQIYNLITLNNLIRAGNIKVIKVNTNFMIIEAEDHILEAIRN